MVNTLYYTGLHTLIARNNYSTLLNVSIGTRGVHPLI